MTRGSCTGRLSTHASRTARVLCALDPHPRISGVCTTRGLPPVSARLDSQRSSSDRARTRLRLVRTRTSTPLLAHVALSSTRKSAQPRRRHTSSPCAQRSRYTHIVRAYRPSAVCTTRPPARVSARHASCTGKGGHSPRQHRVKMFGGALHASQGSSAQRRSSSSPRSAGYEAAPSTCGDVPRASRPSPRLGWRSGTPSVVSAQCPLRGWGSTRSVRGEFAIYHARGRPASARCARVTMAIICGEGAERDSDRALLILRVSGHPTTRTNFRDAIKLIFELRSLPLQATPKKSSFNNAGQYDGIDETTYCSPQSL
ncbi:hypothetical protein DFH08DRAFT_242578 [Mycena albidolilacea]|uniref:Uncharacterized protein n=1 Tax=Mycena albidolilacea TaxID=1033008 RepID=A0AAD6ZWS5_9AGAR|nr:hypothetical protein DFH08DRAFT_242578 [Mycena albidolilacea]